MKSKKVGHNLVTLLEKAKHHSLDEFVIATKEDELEIEKANAYYADKGFEYFNINNLFSKDNLPDLQVLKQYSEKLLRDMKPFILSNA